MGGNNRLNQNIERLLKLGIRAIYCWEVIQDVSTGKKRNKTGASLRFGAKRSDIPHRWAFVYFIPSLHRPYYYYDSI